jgi:hypothetical protein
MPKNKFGGKHKHLSKDVKEKKFDFINPYDQGVCYAFVGKAYGNRQFDAVILKNRQTIRLSVPLKRRSKRISEGNLIKICKADCFTKETYCFEGKCEENEVFYVRNSVEYENNYKNIKSSYDIFADNNTDGVNFEKSEDKIDEKGSRNSVSYEEFLKMSEDEDEDGQESAEGSDWEHL